MVGYVARSLLTDAAALAVSGNPAAAAYLDVICLSDGEGSVRGPLAGVLAALEWGHDLSFEWVVTAPCDTPLLPPDLGERLVNAAMAAGALAAFACTAAGVHPLCAAWRPALAEPLRLHFARGEHTPVQEFVRTAARVRFDDEVAFSNVNTRADAERVSLRLRGQG